MSRQQRALILGLLVAVGLIVAARWLGVWGGGQLAGFAGREREMAEPIHLAPPDKTQENRKIAETVERIMATARPAESGLEESTSVRKILLALGDASPQMRERAEMRLRNLPLVCAPTLETEYAQLKDGLGPEAVARVRQCIDMFHALSEYRRRERESVEWWMRFCLTAYLRDGSANPKWNDVALKFLAHWLNYVDRAGGTNVREMARELEEKQCDDALVAYYLARQYQSEPESDPEVYRKRLGAVADRMENNDYPAPIRIMVIATDAATIEPIEARMAWRSMTGEIRRERSFAAARSIDPAFRMPPPLVYEIGRVLLSNPKYTMMHDPSGKVQAIFENMVSGTAYAPLLKAACLRMRAQSDYSWPGAGTDVQKQRTADLEQAERLLNQAWKMDPASYAVAMQMMELSMQRGRQGDVEEWFKKVMATFPDDLQACRMRLFTLPYEEQLPFARELVRVGNYRSGIPELLIRLHEERADNSPEKENYWAQEEVWKDVQLVYARYVDVWPENVAARSAYAKYCVKCRQWALAHKQFALIGDSPHLAIFGSAESYRYYRRKTERNLGKASETDNAR